MLPQRGRGRNSSSNQRGGRFRAGDIVRHGNRALVRENISGIGKFNNIPEEENELFKQFLEFKKEHKKLTTDESSASYAKMLQEDEDELVNYKFSEHHEIIILLENDDLRWENDPWYLMKRYLNIASFPAGSYKPRAHYEYILKATQSVEINHTFSSNGKEFNYSKAVIKKFITAVEWGINLLGEKEYFHSELKNTIKFNYWDYVEAFNKAFLYENYKRKHTWFFKICPLVFQQEIPNWVYQWWISFGPSITILPEIFQEYYTEWLNYSPKIIQAEKSRKWIEGMASLYFFTEFSIPWIWKWLPEVGITLQKIPCIKRRFCSKFWNKLMQIDPETKKY